MCEELKSLKCKAGTVLRRLRQIRRSRDLSFYEDAELTRLKHASVNAVVAVPAPHWREIAGLTSVKPA